MFWKPSTFYLVRTYKPGNILRVVVVRQKFNFELGSTIMILEELDIK